MILKAHKEFYRSKPFISNVNNNPNKYLINFYFFALIVKRKRFNFKLPRLEFKKTWSVNHKMWCTDYKLFKVYSIFDNGRVRKTISF